MSAPGHGSLLALHYGLVLLVLCRLHLFLCRRRGCLFGSRLLDESQGIRCVERELADGLLPRGAESDVYATIARQKDRPHVVKHSLALLWSQLGIALNRIFYLCFVHIFLLAKRFGFEVGFGNTVFDQEAFRALDTPFGERLIVFHGTSWVGMAFEG